MDTGFICKPNIVMHKRSFLKAEGAGYIGIIEHPARQDQ
ncbi:hypothetical protein ECP02989422_4669 [Escherichia coli P0298942.2]|nr:hypothetical protein ECBCE019MS13_5026 [Escherichia coli BCE019_MS-13]ENA24399.1 hypothetical protein ECP02989421_0007 [Escherichia coli P0298942.1]ENA36982.1 hypothetical protein ECBCE007MS11_0007 [Escherichia coli BCE007_MS-11]ENA73043.1 hypothetical protein EC2730450_5026 [Escherichia coli 2730450]ENA88693.1 hypothetical protein EC2862600_4911 [Escherichia coli 2862600]ENB04757.1 hypothetical protein EC2875150_5001 [Escherichia coli 2875150]ENB22997.1 hypothetical protein ECBCE030MS09_5